MRKLIEVRLGGGRVQSGLLPLSALGLIRDLLSAMQEEGGGAEAWDHTNAHIEVIGAASTLAAVHTEMVSALRPPSDKFVRRAKKYKLHQKGREFVIDHFAPGSVWTYAEVISGSRGKPKVYFDAEYRDRLLKKASGNIHGQDEIYARIARVGGTKTPTVNLEMPGQKNFTCKIKTRELAKMLGGRLFETVKLSLDAEWDCETAEMMDATVTGIDLKWVDIHLGEILEQHGGRLPLDLSIPTTAELLKMRAYERAEIDKRD
jgi:hypothetical protein